MRWELEILRAMHSCLYIVNTYIMVFWKGDNEIDKVRKELTDIFPEVNNYTTSNWRSPQSQSKRDKNKSTLKYIEEWI